MRRTEREAKQEKLEAKRERFASALLNDYASIFGTSAGQRVLNDILSQCYFFNTTFTGNSATFRNEGKRQIAIYILNVLMKAKPEIIAQVYSNKKQLKELFDKTE